MDEFEDDDDAWMLDIPIPGDKRRRESDDEDDDGGEMSGGRLFEFDIQEGEMPRRWRNIVHKTRHKATLRQTREARDGDRLGNAMSEAVRMALVSIVSHHPNLKDDDRIHFTMQSNAFAQRTNHCFQSCQFRVDEIGDDEEGSSARFDTYMDQLAKQLNSSQTFSPGDDFSLEVTTIRMPEEGGRSKKYDVAKAKVRGIQKRSRIVIKNDDNLCCLRAVVTMRAWTDEQARQFPPSSYDSLRRGLPCQKAQALQLAREAGVSTTEPLGLADIEKIQRVLSPTYQIKVMKIGRPHMIVYAGPEAQRRIFLVLEDDPKTKKVPRNEVGERRPLGPPKNGLVEVERDPPLFVYADFEATTDDQGFQTAILVGYETSESEECCTIYGTDCTERFVEELEGLAVDEDGDDRRVIVIFHNLKGYDGMLLLRHMYAEHREVTGMVTVGAKVLSFSSDRLTFKDSLCFLPFPLASFPATFGIVELCKGFFPHLFNTSANQSYVGPIPDARYYDPDGMSSKKREEFLRWHATKVAEDYVFGLKRDMTQYCESDVKLLKAGCVKFVKEFRGPAQFDPMEKCLTIASACNRYWRKVHLSPKTVAVPPFNGWKGAQPRQSMQATQWLSYKNFLLRGDDTEATDVIRHAFNGGEVRIRGMLVDGADTERRVVYEYHGCFYHGCISCFPHQRFTTTSRRRGDRTFQECFEATANKKQRLEADGWVVEVMWECQWMKCLKEAQGTLEEWLTRWNPMTPLEPRDAFFGGRTNAVKLHHRCGEGERILYQDVTSLYPWVNKYALYPTGHPSIITQFADDTDLQEYFGLVKLTIRPPRGLYHPVLPFRQGGKLTFPLCRTCVETQMSVTLSERSYHCPHDDEQRQLTGTWCTPKVREALKRGYTIVRLHEVWHFPPNQQKFGLFRDYVNTWLKNKTEASGYPHWADTVEKKQQYVNAYAEKEGIHLDADNIAKNPGRKATAKLMLNSFWGKFGENLRKSSTRQVTTPAELYALVTDPLKEVTNVRVYSDEVLEVVFSVADEECVENGKTNLFVAAFTTCHARLKLYSYLHAMQQRVLYFDTDSVIYSQERGQSELPIGDFLGDLTNEVDPGDHIVDFTSGGPKNYGYRTMNGKVECKVRGFSLGSVRGHAQLNYERLRQNVLEELVDPQENRRNIPVTNPHFFTRDATTKRLRVIPRTKEYGLVFDKRVVDRNTFKSYPYGYA